MCLKTGLIRLPGIPNSEGYIDEVVFVHTTPTRGICFVVYRQDRNVTTHQEVSIDQVCSDDVVNIRLVMQNIICHF